MSKLFAFKNTVRRASRQMESYRNGREFSDFDLSLGFFSFCTWLAEGIKLEQLSPEMTQMHVSNVNSTARKSAEYFCISYLNNPGFLSGVKTFYPSFSPSDEIQMSVELVHPSEPNYHLWEYSLTRTVILLTRAIGYDFCDGKAQIFLSVSLPELLSDAVLWVSEHLPETALNPMLETFFEFYPFVYVEMFPNETVTNSTHNQNSNSQISQRHPNQLQQSDGCGCIVILFLLPFAYLVFYSISNFWTL